MGEEAYRAHERWQIEIDDYRNQLMEIAQASSRYAGGEIRHETRELIIFGVGEPTKALEAEMKRAPANVKVSWRKAPYSLAELSAEAHRIITEQPRGRIYTIGPRHDGTGLHLTTADRALLDAHDPREALSTRYPVAIEYGEPPHYATTTRST